MAEVYAAHELHTFHRLRHIPVRDKTHVALVDALSNDAEGDDY